jgi:mono/diheme cytochrome c family protein
MKKILYVSASLLLTTSASVACAQSSGADLYKTNCILCHGETGEADTPAGKTFKAASFNTPDGLKKTDSELAVIIKNGKDKMPPWSDVLTDDQVKDVIAYIRTLKKK